MRTSLFLVIAFGASASMALAEPLPPPAGPTENATTEAHATGPITLTEAEMDRVAAAGAIVIAGAIVVSNPDDSSRVAKPRVRGNLVYLRR